MYSMSSVHAVNESINVTLRNFYQNTHTEVFPPDEIEEEVGSSKGSLESARDCGVSCRIV